jgi:signal transduction histidine kinase
VKTFLGGLAARIALASLSVSAVAVAIVAVGVLIFGEASFTWLMVQHGSDTATARAMFDESVRTALVVAAVVAVAAALTWGLYLARRISRPLEQVGSAARRLAQGERGVQVSRAGPAELASLADSFNQLSTQLEQQERERVELIENFAHELRTPLTNLLGYLHGMRDGVVEPGPEVLDALREEVERLHRLSMSLDALTESGSTDTGARMARVDLVALIRSAVDLSAPLFERAHVRVELDLPPSLAAFAVPDHLSQVLSNLLQNGQRYTPPGGTVTVTARRDGGSLLVVVANTGAQVPASQLARVFERFYRVDPSRDRATGGAGIGLAIVKQLVEQAGGRVGAESSAGMTRFWFSIPT